MVGLVWLLVDLFCEVWLVFSLIVVLGVVLVVLTRSMGLVLFGCFCLLLDCRLLVFGLGLLGLACLLLIVGCFVLGLVF